MNSSKLFVKLIYNNAVLRSAVHVQATIVGAASEVGENLALLMRQNMKLSQINLFDQLAKVTGIAKELQRIPGRPKIKAFVGDSYLPASVTESDLVIMVERTTRKYQQTVDQMLASNAPLVHRLCQVLAKYNQDAFLAISTSPVNCIVPFASTCMYNFGCYNPFRIFGITEVDVARTIAYTANTMSIDPNILYIPVIGGHSDETILPLFSNMKPSYYSVDSQQADALTRLVRRAGSDILEKKQGLNSAILCPAWAINTFVDKMLDAILGREVDLNALTANAHFKTKFFSGPTRVGADGIVQTCGDFELNSLESNNLQQVCSCLNVDVARGEDYVNIMEKAGRRF